MTSNTWRNLCVVLGAVCAWQAWRGCTREAPEVTQAECGTPTNAPARERTAASTPTDRWSETKPSATTDDTEAPAPPENTDGDAMFGFRIPSWTRTFLPQPGEDLRAYRDRMIPLAQLAVAPHRHRVSRSIDDFAKLANLDSTQRAELDAAAKETASAIQDRLFQAALGGEFDPSTFKPMAGVAVARDVLDLVDRGNKRFLGRLREDQRGVLANHPFDFGDYLVFSTRWEDAISGL